MFDLYNDHTCPQPAFEEFDRVCGGEPAWGLPASSRKERDASLAQNLAHYIEGWAHADTTKIVQAVSSDYLFIDPMVGSFDRKTLPDYIVILKQRVGFKTLPTYPGKICLDQMASVPPRAPRLRYWRSIPELGLAGPSEIHVIGARISKEVVSYELNEITEQLRRAA